MNDHSLESLHADPANWKWGIFYVCRADPRLIVPKRIQGLGWTINFGRPFAVPFLVLLLALILGPIYAARAMGASGDVLMTVKVIVVTLAVAVLFVCHALSKKGTASTGSTDSEKRR